MEKPTILGYSRFDQQVRWLSPY